MTDCCKVMLVFFFKCSAKYALRKKKSSEFTLTKVILKEVFGSLKSIFFSICLKLHFGFLGLFQLESI